MKPPQLRPVFVCPNHNSQFTQTTRTPPHYAPDHAIASHTHAMKTRPTGETSHNHPMPEHLVDNARRRNRIAGIAAEHFRETITRTARQLESAYPGKQALVSAEMAAAALSGVLAALAGETTVERLGIDPYSVPAMAVAALTVPARREADRE